MCLGLCQGVCYDIQSSEVSIIIIIPIPQMRKLRLALRLDLEPESTKVLAAKALTSSVSRDPVAEEPGWSRGLWQGDREPKLPWAKQSSTSWGRPRPCRPTCIAGQGWPGGSALPQRNPREARPGSSDNKATYMELKQNTSDSKKHDSLEAAPPECL